MGIWPVFGTNWEKSVHITCKVFYDLQTACKRNGAFCLVNQREDRPTLADSPLCYTAPAVPSNLR